MIALYLTHPAMAERVRCARFHRIRLARHSKSGTPGKAGTRTMELQFTREQEARWPASLGAKGRPTPVNY